MKTCSKCHESKPLNMFSPHAGRKDGRKTYCKSCCNVARRAQYQANPEKGRLAGRIRYHINPEKERAASQRWRQANPEKVRAASRAWGRANPDKKRLKKARRRARKMNAPINDLSAAQFAEICAAFQHRCAYCGRKAKKLTIDHVTPYAHNGSNTVWNVVPACKSCNSKKQAGPVLQPVQPLLLTIAK